MDIEDIALNLIKENPLNPRKIFTGLEELAEDLKSRGMLQPVMVRPIKSAYELVFGARRYRAAVLAKLSRIPAIVREMSDDEALEAMIVENGKRADVHPLEEAAGFRTWLERGQEIAAIAARVGKPEEYVYKRIKFLDLIKPAQEAFLDGVINAGHALILCRLETDDQVKAFEACFTDRYGNKDKEPRPVNGLKEWVRSNLQLKLSKAPFKLSDVSLLPGAGACVTCPKRSGRNTLLFSDIRESDLCSDPTCYGQKLQNHIIKALADAGGAGKTLVSITDDYELSKKHTPGDPLPRKLYRRITEKKDRCESMERAIYVCGDDAGRFENICKDQECEKHWKDRAESEARQEKWRRDQIRQETDRKRKTEIRRHILDASLAKVSFPPARRVLEIAAVGAFSNSWNELQKSIAGRLKWEKITHSSGYGTDFEGMMRKHLADFDDAGLVRLIVEIALSRQLQDVYRGQSDRLLELAGEVKIDHKKIQADLQKQFKERDKAKAQKARAKTKKSAAKK